MKDAIVIDSEFPKGTKDLFYCLYLACVHHMKKISPMDMKKISAKIHVGIVMKWGKILLSILSFINTNIVGMILYKALETSCSYKKISSNDVINVWNSYLFQKVSIH